MTEKIREHPASLEKVLGWARSIAFDPTLLVEDGNRWRVLSAAELRQRKMSFVKRSEEYARWQVSAYESGECSYPW